MFADIASVSSHQSVVKCVIINLAKRGYCNAGVCPSLCAYVCVCLSVYVFVCSHISHNNFVKCGPFWRHDVFLTPWLTFCRHCVLLTYFRRHDVYFTPWRTFSTSWRVFLHHDVLFDLMNNAIFFKRRQIILIFDTVEVYIYTDEGFARFRILWILVAKLVCVCLSVCVSVCSKPAIYHCIKCGPIITNLYTWR